MVILLQKCRTWLEMSSGEEKKEKKGKKERDFQTLSALSISRKTLMINLKDPKDVKSDCL